MHIRLFTLIKRFNLYKRATLLRFFCVKPSLWYYKTKSERERVALSLRTGDANFAHKVSLYILSEESCIWIGMPRMRPISSPTGSTL